ncbi:ribosome small subunit-dependent GTPase A [Xylanibacillus composti]|uniref:Small ribosomal subunit biogenesis GTPase RsgA n=1 Tax=Xylanibacillus composti TaxID=1572762 RepID=A0A8J4GYW4_9BACL|nr:ribosome small subunit-dependent GTPase A [Xylanibacillus composti]MDT9725601.1 ribosome small subunit-dependent GTPase A [Xylanibacillus composti]GIQ67694.1 putative ribosome biogenesis GTPase RsgA [Xylanibacillus composti]
MPEGKIVKALSGYYYVLLEQGGDTVQCRARGVFKKRGITPLVGDRVQIELSSPKEGTVVEVKPRSSFLVRPPVANVDVAVLVFSVAEPALSWQLLDKFLVHIEHAGLDAVICLTKADLADEEAEAHLVQTKQMYEAIGYAVIETSVRSGMGLRALEEAINGRTAVLAGQSGVGKSSLINALVPGKEMETGEISMRLGRGRHTTRHVELIPLQSGGVVLDTPGFSQLDFANVETDDLGSCFREFVPLAEQCKFRGCLHRSEPSCAVRGAAETGQLFSSRYAHYELFFDELKDRKRRY